MKECLIIGRSPFIKEVDWSRINWKRFFVICINYPVPNIPVDVVIARDTIEPKLAPATEFISPKTGWEFTNEGSDLKGVEKEVRFCCYTSTSAVDFAVLRGFKTVYLMGIDHKEDNQPLVHYDGVVNNIPASALASKSAKDFICKYKKSLNLYQTNPAVKDDWDLPFKPVSDLYL